MKQSTDTLLHAVTVTRNAYLSSFVAYLRATNKLPRFDATLQMPTAHTSELILEVGSVKVLDKFLAVMRGPELCMQQASMNLIKKYGAFGGTVPPFVDGNRMLEIDFQQAGPFQYLIIISHRTISYEENH